jgi:hypothetical protein
MNIHLFEKLQKEGQISPASAEKLKELNKRYSLHWELKTLLYLGVLLLSGGLGILIYKNIDTIGHQAILAGIAIICGLSFAYCTRKKLPFSWQKVPAPNGFFDYILLLGCLTFITFVTYLQVQYNVFGTRYGLATFFPMLVLMFSAYYYDHLGILSMAITNFSAWLGLTITPFQLFAVDSFFVTTRLIYTGIFLGALLIAIALLSEKHDKKKHFAFTYSNFGVHIFMIACLYGLMTGGIDYHRYQTYDWSFMVWFTVMMAAIIFCYKEAFKRKSFYFLMILALYAYVAISYIVLKGLIAMDDIGALYLGLMYFIASGIGFVIFLVNINKRLKKS